MSDLHKKIKSFREEKNFTQAELAEGLGITRQTYAKIESGDKEISTEQLSKICGMFNIPLSTFLVASPNIVSIGNNKMLLDYVYINEDKVNSYLGSLGISTTSQKNHKTTDTDNKVKKQVNFSETLTSQSKSDRLINELSRNSLLTEDPEVGCFFKLTSELKEVDTAKTLYNLFNLMELMENNNGKRIVEDQYKFIFQLVKKDLDQEMKAIKLMTKFNGFDFYISLDEKWITNNRYFNSINTVVCKVKQIIRKENEIPIIRFPSLSVMPKKNYDEFVDQLIKAGEQLGQKIPLYYPEDSIIVEPIFIYQ